jgi:hypothetical protein
MAVSDHTAPLRRGRGAQRAGVEPKQSSLKEKPNVIERERGREMRVQLLRLPQLLVR